MAMKILSQRAAFLIFLCTIQFMVIVCDSVDSCNVNFQFFFFFKFPFYLCAVLLYLSKTFHVLILWVFLAQKQYRK